MKNFILLLLVAYVSVSQAHVVVTIEGKPSPPTVYDIVVTRSQGDLDRVAMQFNGARPGMFPALVSVRTGNWVHITNTVDQAAEELSAAEEASKTVEQKVAENAFFTLTETILTAIADPRAGETPPIKLSFAEINTLIKAIQTVDPMQAVLIAVELLSIDAELKRFDILWWDKAATHVIQE